MLCTEIGTSNDNYKSFQIYHSNLIVKDIETLTKSKLLLLLEMSFSSKITINKLCEPIGEEGGYTHKQTIFYEYKCSSHTDAIKRFIPNNYKVCHVETRGEGK